MHFRCKTQNFSGGLRPLTPIFSGGLRPQTPCSVIWKTPFKIPGYATGPGPFMTVLSGQFMSEHIKVVREDHV